MRNKLIEVKEIFDKLAKVSSIKSKEVILKQNEDNELFKACLKFLLDDNITTGLDTKKLNKKVPLLNTDIDLDIRHMFSYIQGNNTGTDENISYVKTYINYFDDDMKDFLCKLFTKKLKCGASTKIVNKVYKGFIKTHDIMLANKYEGVLKEEVSMSLKMDGIRMSIVTIDDETKALTRQGKIIDGINYILDEYKRLELDSYFIDGEIIRINKEGISSDDNFRLTTKIVNSKDNNKSDLEFVIFDMTPMEDYLNHSSKMIYKERLELMNTLIGDKSDIFRLVPKYGTTKDPLVINEVLNKVVNEGQEGLILNTLSGKYEFGKRPKSLLKVKKFKTADMLVYDIFEGEGALEGMLGGIKLKGLYDEELLFTDCGSGFTLDERRYLWNHKGKILNKIVEVRYFEISKNAKTGIKSLRFCTWQGMDYIRKDKEGLNDTNIE